MAKKSERKKLKRPKSSGIGTPVMVRMHAPQINALDNWIRDTGISRPEAVRQLISWALERARR